MASTTRTPWVLGTAALAALIAAGGWFGAISPRLDAAEMLRQQAESEEARAGQLQVQLAALQADFERLPELQAELAELQVQLPPALELPTLTRQVSAIAGQTGVFLVSVSPSLPQPVGAVAPEPAPVPVDGEQPAEGEQTDADGAPAPVPEPAGPGLYAMPVEMTVLGGYGNTIAFIDELQRANPRLLLVSSVAATGQDEAGAQGGRPAVAKGDAETIIQFLAFVVPETGTTPMDGDVAVDPAPLPVPSQPGGFAPST